MKKILFIGLLFIFCVSATFAQARFGITAGLNTSNINHDMEVAHSYKFKAGFQAGVVMDYAFTNKFSVIPELLFSQRGTKYKGGDSDGSYSSSMTMNYIQLPINAANKFDAGFGSKIFVFAGPYLGYYISGKNKSESIIDGKKNNSSSIIDSKPLDFGLNAGVGYQYEKVFFKLQYNHGLSNTATNSDKSYSYTGKHHSVKNVNIAVTAGYYF